MQWLNKVADELVAKKPHGEILVESGVSPSGTYHVGTLREVLTCDAILLELRRRGRQARHIHYVDDLDVLRKVPANVPSDFEQYLGTPLCDVPAPDSSGGSYADYFLNDFLGAAKALHMEMDVMRSHERYRAGEMTDVLEQALDNIGEIRKIISEVSGRQLEEDWAPIQVMEGGYLKNRRFVSLDKSAKTLKYLDADDKEEETSYAKGEVKLNWRVDWPARWHQLGIDVEPFGRDHATKGGSYDTGSAICQKVYNSAPPLPVPYNFINMVGETKKMSKSAGNIIAISDMVKVLPPEVVRYFTLRYAPDKLLFFDPDNVAKLIDDYAALLAKTNKTDDEKQLVDICNVGKDSVVSSVPFSHLVAAYQAAGRKPERAIATLSRSEYADTATAQAKVIKSELEFINNWLDEWATDKLKFDVKDEVSKDNLTDEDKAILAELADKVGGVKKPDAEWFHKAIYEIKENRSIKPEQIFQPLYTVLIGKSYGPRAGHFLADLVADRGQDWLIKRLRLEA